MYNHSRIPQKHSVAEERKTETSRDIDSEIDWKIIDQLHNAVLNFSKNSMNAKSIMFTLIGVIVAALLKNERSFGCNERLLLIIVVILFWLYDSFTYYYQEKLRSQIDVRFHSLKKRHASKELNDEFTLPDNRSSCGRVWRSLFWNYSILFYLIILVVIFYWPIFNQ